MCALPEGELMYALPDGEMISFDAGLIWPLPLPGTDTVTRAGKLLPIACNEQA